MPRLTQGRISLQGATLVAPSPRYCHVIRECFQTRLKAVTAFCYSCSIIRSHSHLFLRPVWLCLSYAYKRRVTVFLMIGPLSCSLQPCRNGRNIPCPLLVSQKGAVLFFGSQFLAHAATNTCDITVCRAPCKRAVVSVRL